jgi:pantoate--beta-alanine ligase
MQVIRTVDEMQRLARTARAEGRSIGCVPTMGSLHAGHASLIAHASTRHPVVVTSVFVNPTQFGPNEDFERYPRDLDRDLEVVERAGGTAVFAPSVDEMYPAGASTMVRMTGVAEPFEGRHRPGHFDGVATVVCKLLEAMRPDVAYFGQKDYQQTLVVRRMVRDLFLPVTIDVRPTLREESGLAMSSRNIYLQATDRDRASAIFRALRTGQALAHTGERRRAVYEEVMRGDLGEADDMRVEYLEAACAADLATPDVFEVHDEIVLLAAVRLGTTRLIDNLLATIGGTT